MKRKLIFIAVLLFSLGVSVYAAENTTQMQREAPQSINPTMTATIGDIYFSPRFYLAGKRYNFQEIQRVFDLTNQETRFLFNKSKNAWRTTFHGIHDEANDLVQKTVESFNRFIGESAENRARVLDELQKMRIEEERDKVRRVLDRDAHFVKRKNEFIGGKISLGCQFEPPAGPYVGSDSKFDTIMWTNPAAAMGFRYMRFFGEGSVAHGIIVEGILGGAFVLDRFHSGINLMYGLKTGQFYAGFGAFVYYTQYRIESFRKSNFEPGLILVFGREFRGIGKSKLQIGIEIKGTPFAITRVSDNERVRYISVALEFGIGY